MYLGAALGGISAFISLLGFGWSENILIQSILICFTSLRFEIFFLLLVYFGVIVNSKYHIFNTNNLFRRNRKYYLASFFLPFLVFYGYIVVTKMIDNLGPEGVLKMAEKGIYRQAAVRARYLSSLKEYKKYKLDLIKFEQTMLSRDILAREFEKSFVQNIGVISKEEAFLRREIGKELIDPTNTIYEIKK